MIDYFNFLVCAVVTNKIKNYLNMMPSDPMFKSDFFRISFARYKNDEILHLYNFQYVLFAIVHQLEADKFVSHRHIQ